MIKFKINTPIITRNKSGGINGFVLPIFNANEKFVTECPKQIYLTTIMPYEVKGPHLHNKRDGLFTCIKGNIKIVTKIDNKYAELFSGQNANYASVIVPRGVECTLINIGDEDAYVLNMPSEPYDPSDNFSPTWDNYFK